MNELEKKIKDLVTEEYGKMTFSKKYSNQARLANTCQSIIYKDWGISSNKMWKLVDKYVEELIPDHLD